MSYKLGQRIKGNNGTVSFDGHFVTIDRKGILARTSVGKGLKRIPLASVVAVQWKQPGIVNGFIQFTVPGGNEVRSRFGRQTQDARQDENSVVVTQWSASAMKELKDAVEEAIKVRAMPHSSAAVSTADELLKLVSLRDAGALTAREFEAQKAKLLGK